MSEDHNKSSRFPVAVLVLIGFAFLLHFGHFRSPKQPFVGQAQVIRDGSVKQGRWQVNCDPRGSKVLTQAASIFAGSQNLDPNLPLWSAVDGEVQSVPLPATHRPPVDDPVFSGGPRVAFEWAREAFVVHGTLFENELSPTLFSGNLQAALPYPGLRGTPPGHTLELLDALPRRLERLAFVDIAAVQFRPLYRTELEEAWAQWEFFPLRELASVMGRGFAYFQWRGHSLIALELADSGGAKEYITKRFPSSVIHNDAQWSYGTKVQGFNPDGPAWLVRGSTLIASRKGGTEPLAQLLEERYRKDRPSEPEDPFLKELGRLAGSQPGWHLCLVDRTDSSPFDWAVLLRWPLKKSTRAVGYVIVDLKSPRKLPK